MGDNCSEVIIKKKIDAISTFFRIFAIIVTIAVVIASALVLSSFGMLIVLLAVFVTYLVFKYTDIEYEYAFVNGQLDIDCIYQKKKRKPAKSFNFDKLEVMGPVNHQKILAYEKRPNIKNFNFTSGFEDRDVYVAILVGQSGGLGRLYFEPNEAMIKSIYQNSPSRVFKEVK